MLSRLQQSSSKQPLLRQPPPRLSQSDSAGDPSVVQFRQNVPRRGPSQSQERLLRQQSSEERDCNRRGFTDETGIRLSDRYRPLDPKERPSFSASGSEMGKMQDDETDHKRQLSGLHQNVGGPAPLRFRPDLPRHPPMPQPRGMRPPSLLALSIERPLSLNHQQLNTPHIELDEPPSLSHSDQNHPSRAEEVRSECPPTQLKQGNRRPPLQVRHNIERQSLPPVEQRPIAMQECPRPSRPPRPPGLPEGIRQPQLPSARQPLIPQHLRPPHFSEEKRSSSSPLQNFQRPPSFLNGNVLRPSSSVQEDRFLSQGQMLPVPTLRPDNEMQKYHGLQAPSDLERQTSGETRRNVAAVYDSAKSNSAYKEEMHRLPQSLKHGPQSLMGKMQDDESDHQFQRSSPQQNAGAPMPLRFRPDLPRPPPIPQLRGPPSLMDLNLQHPPFPPPIRPALPPPAVCGVSDSIAAPMLKSDSQQPFSTRQGFMHDSTSQSVGDVHTSTASTYQVGMSDEPLQFTGRMLPRSVDNSFPHNQSSQVSKPGTCLPFSSSTAQLPGTSNYQVGMSDEPLQFTGRMPVPRMQDPSVLQRLPSSNILPLTAPQPSENIYRMQLTGNYSVGMLDKPLQFTGRMAAPHIQDSSSNPQLAVGSSVRPGFSSGNVSLQPVADKNQIQAAVTHLVGMSDEPLRFTGRMPVPRLPDTSSYRHPHHLPDSGVRPLSSSQASISTAVSTSVQTLQAPMRPPLGLPPPPFIGIPPPRPLAPPQIGTGPPLMGLPPPDSVTGPGARPPPPFPGGTALRPPVDGSITLPGNELSHPLRAPVAGAMLPRPPFFSSMPNLVS